MKNRTFTNDQRGLTRRQLLGLATLTGAGLAAASIGPLEANAALEGGSTPNANTGSAKKEAFEPLADFKYDLEASGGWVGEGGTAKEVTVEQFPVSQSIAGVSMRLKPGAIRELHWRAIAGEWGYVVDRPEAG